MTLGNIHSPQWPTFDNCRGYTCGRELPWAPEESLSIDLFVYSKQPNDIRRDDLAASLKTRGWEIFHLNPATLSEVSGDLLGDELVYAVRAVDDLRRLRDLVAKRESMAIEVMFEEESAAGCAITVVSPFDARSEYGDTLEENFPRQVASDVLEAKAGYNVRTAEGRGEISYKLQVDVWESLGELTGGLLEDPQSGRYLRVGPEGPQVVFEAEPPEGSQADALAGWIRAAAAQGFPVEARKRDSANISPERLSEADLERFLKFTQEHPWPDPFNGVGMVLMILDDYKKKKGKAYAQEKAPWLAEMKGRYTRPRRKRPGRPQDR